MRCAPSIKSPSRTEKITAVAGRTSTSELVNSTFLQNDALQLQTIRVYSGSLNKNTAFANVSCLKSTTSAEVVQKVLDKFGINDHPTDFQLAEVSTEENIIRGERRLNSLEKPLELQIKWRNENSSNNFYLRRKVSSVNTAEWIHRTEDLSTVRDVWTHKQERDTPDDLCSLNTLTEQNLLSSLSARFRKDTIYTYVNSILIAVNPFKDLPIYNVDIVMQYNNKRRDEMPPHIFAVANEALRNMLLKRQNQCMVISGESGSGKTETTRHIIHWLTTAQNRCRTNTLAQSILGAGELLEAFGNAQTSRNKNSSRFGRFIQLEYRSDGSVHGANIEKYLLEKSRITNIAPNERSYHVFYYLLAGCSQPLYDQLSLKAVSGFNYLNQCVVTVDGVDDKAGFIKLQRSMCMVGITDEIQKNIFKVLSAILHLGNVTFRQQNNHRTSEECVVISDVEALETVAQLLSVNCDLLREALTTRKSFARGEQFITHYKRVDATATRDTLSKSLYTYLFDWLLSHVNRGLVAGNRRSEHYLSIGLLDIFGFEDFKHGNRFEQFCINFANEQLQHFFDQHIFKLEQDEYKREKIKWEMVGYKDNECCLELFKGKPVGLLHLLDEENSFPGGSDQSLLQKFNDQHAAHENYTITPIPENTFEIVHYAGPVQYKIDEFLEKNRGHMRADIVHVLKSSQSLFIKRLIGCDPVALARWTLLRNYISGVFACRNAILSHSESPSERDQGVSFRPRNKSDGGDGNRSVRDRASAYMNDYQPIPLLEVDGPKIRRSSDGPKQNQPSPRRSESRDIFHIPASKHRQARQQQCFRTNPRGRRQARSTVVGQFMSSLNSLVKVLNSGTPHFIRCIKSNEEGAPNLFEQHFVDRQLRYTGMLETIQIRKASYPVRYNKEEFLNQFRLLFRESQQQDGNIEKFFEWAQIEKGQYQLGLTKVFMREGPLQILNEYQDRLILGKVQKLQSHVRGWLCRERFTRLRFTVIYIQTQWRVYTRRRREEAASIITASLRMYVQRKRFVTMREAAVKIQRAWRKKHNLTFPDKSRTSDLGGLYGGIDKEELQETIYNDVMSTLKNFDFLEEHIRLDQSTPAPGHLHSSPQPTSGDEPFLTPSPGPPLSPICDPITTRGRAAFAVPPKLNELDQEMPDELKLETVAGDNQPKISADGTTPSKQIPTWRHEGASTAESGGSPLQRGGPTRTPFARSHSVTDPPATGNLTRSSSGYNTSASSTWTEVQTTSFKFMRSKEEQDTHPHFAGRRSRKRRSIKSNKKEEGSDRLSKSLEDLNDLELSAIKKPKPDSTQSSALPTLAHIFKGVTAPRGSVCNSCGKKLQSRIFLTLKPMQCQAQTCHKIFHRNCIAKAGQCMPTYEQPKRVLANNLGEILMLENFILQKKEEMRAQGEKVVHDKVLSRTFTSALREFTMYLTRTEAALSANPLNNIFNLYHEECTTIFEHCLTKVCSSDTKRLESKQAIKAMFDSMLENFMYCKHETSFQENARRSLLASNTVREKLTISRATKAGFVEFNGHRLIDTVYSIQMCCMHCKKKINTLDKCKFCQGCKTTFHFKCYKLSSTQCSGIPVSSPSSQPKPFFGTTIAELVASEGNVNIPRNLDKIMLVLEQNGLYTVGLYRVNANQNQMKSLKNKLLVNNPDLVIDGMVPATLAAMVKMFFRELPEPILTFGLYAEFMQTAKCDVSTRTKALLEVVHKLPKINFLVFERLVYHLAQVAKEEETNKMNAGSLAVIFAPNLLRPAVEPSAMQALDEIKLRTVVLQCIVEAMVDKFKEGLLTINEMDDANPSPEVAERKAKYLVQLAYMPHPDEIAAAPHPPTDPTTSDTESSSLSQGVETPLRSVTRNRPSLQERRRAPSRRHSSSPSRGGPARSIADGVKRKEGGAKRGKGKSSYQWNT